MCFSAENLNYFSLSASPAVVKLNRHITEQVSPSGEVGVTDYSSPAGCSPWQRNPAGLLQRPQRAVPVSPSI